MRAALLALLLCAACARTEPATMVYGNVVDFRREPVKQFNDRRTCEITRGMLHKQSLGVTQYYDCENPAPTK